MVIGRLLASRSRVKAGTKQHAKTRTPVLGSSTATGRRHVFQRQLAILRSCLWCEVVLPLPLSWQ